METGRGQVAISSSKNFSANPAHRKPTEELSIHVSRPLAGELHRLRGAQ